MKFYEIAFIGFVVAWLFAGCSAIQQGETETPPVPVSDLDSQEVHAVCAAACALNEEFDFTTCASAVMKALPAMEAILTVAGCDARCDEFLGKISKPEKLDANCLMSAIQRADCKLVAGCMGVD